MQNSVQEAVLAPPPEADALQRRDEILQAIALAAERFLTEGLWEQEIDVVLAEFGGAAQVSRIYIFENAHDEHGSLLSNQRYEWVAEGIPPEIENPELQNLSLQDTGFERWVEFLGRGDLVHGNVRDFPHSEQSLLEAQGIQSILVVPIFAGGAWWGFMGLDDCRMERDWTTAETEALKTAADILGAAIHRQQTEIALRESEERYRRLVEQSPDTIAVHQYGKLVYVNSAGARLLAVANPADLLGRSILEFIYPADRARVKERIRRVQERDRESGALEVRLVRTDQSVIAVETTAIPIRYEGQRAVQVVVRDITVRKRAEEDARQIIREQTARAAAETAERHARFLAEASAILSSSLDYPTTLRSVARLAISALSDSCVICIVGEDGQPQGLEVAHADPEKEEILRTILTRDPPNPEAPRSPLSRVLGTGQPEIVPEISEEWLHTGLTEPEHLRLCRLTQPTSLMCVPLSARGRVLGAMSFGLMRADKRYHAGDLVLAEELASHAALAVDNARLYQEAQQASQAKSEFMAIMSHELRTPLTAITTYAELLTDELAGPCTAEQKRQLGVILGSAVHLSKLIDEILTYTRASAGRLNVLSEPVDVGAFAREVAAWIEPIANAQGLPLQVEISARSLVLETDSTRLRQILVNLLSNAVRFTERGEIGLRVQSSADSVEFHVWDSGIGIAAEHQEKIFEPFWQVDQSVTRRTNGTGLGLSVASRFAQLLGGRLTVESNPGSGSTFTLQLPIASDKAG